MKKYFLILMILPSLIFAQSNSNSSLLELKNQIDFTSSNTIRLPDPTEITGKKKPGLAIIYSLLLPGMGELYANGYDSGKYFTIADGVLWGTLVGFNVYGNQQRDNYKAFAQSNGGVTLDGKDEIYFATIGEYLSVDQFNQAMELNRDFGEVYNTSTHYWEWADNSERREYRNMWTSSENAFNNMRFIVGGLILNRLISAINAARLVVAYNKNLEENVSWNVSMNVISRYSEPALALNFTTSF